MSRHLVEAVPEENGLVRLSPAERRHAEKVLRLGEGDAVEIFDGRGAEAEGRLIRHPEGGLAVQVIRKRLSVRSADKLQIRAICALTRGERLRWIVEKLTELDVAGMIFFQAKRSTREYAERTTERLNKYSIAAAKQCGRSDLPEIHVLSDLKTALSMSGSEGDRYIFLQSAADRLAAPFDADPAKAAVALFGPEGGFDASEERMAQAAGFRPISLGPLTLRAETAIIAGIALLNFLYRKRAL